MENISPEIVPIYAYAIDLLSAREYSKKSLAEKLQKKFPSAPKDEIEEVLELLVQKKYLDERRSIENFLRYRREYSPRGKRMIAQDMYTKKFDSDISSQVLEELFPEEEEQKDCIILAQKKYDSLVLLNDEQKKRDKVFRFLSGKGFPFALIQCAWEEVSKGS
jgi:regulatory protein